MVETMSNLDAATLELVRLALAEDVGSGDVTARYFVPESAQSAGRVIAKEPGVLAGMGVASRVLLEVDPTIVIEPLKQDGDVLSKGDVVMKLSGSSRSLLTAERTMLNFLQRLSGVASQTARYVAALGNSQTKLLDTRKTTPGWRRLEKAAVKAGGGTNHRIGLHDMVMVKDNHLLAEARLEELQAAIDAVHRDHPGMKIELEADRISQVEGFLTLRGVDVILLDNMQLEEMRRCVELAHGRLKLEASGNVTLERLAQIAETGVDFVSCGALTHSAKALDLSLDFTLAG